MGFKPNSVLVQSQKMTSKRYIASFEQSTTSKSFEILDFSPWSYSSDSGTITGSEMYSFFREPNSFFVSNLSALVGRCNELFINMT